MKITFFKYQGTGNDFIMLDNLSGEYNHLSVSQIQRLCDRHFGIGADGLIRINMHDGFDFEMDYFNSDGSKSFCGNGARCSVAFAEFLGINVEQAKFMAIDGVHQARKLNGLISLEMNPVKEILEKDNSYVVHTGSPHYVHGVENLNDLDVVTFGKSIRYSPEYAKDGINVNLMERIDQSSIKIATYERGVENETYSCGTGATACALVYSQLLELNGTQFIHVHVKGGELIIGFKRNADGSFTDITLTGPAEFVFKGEMNV